MFSFCAIHYYISSLCRRRRSSDTLKGRFRFRSSFAATAITLLIFGALFAVIGFLLFLVVRQAVSLLSDNRDLIAEYIRSPELFDMLRENLLSGGLLTAASSVVKTLFQAVPVAVTFVVITFSMTVFFMHHLGDLRDRLLKRAGEYRSLLSRVFHIAYALVRKFIRSYLILYAVTFVEAVFIFYLIAILFILQKNYIGGIFLLLYFLFTVVLRQILEPRIVSDSVKVNPLVVLTAIYFSVVSMNIWVLFYVVSVFMAFRVLNQAGIFEKG